MQAGTLLILRRGLERQCPQCGMEKLFGRWNVLRKSCSHCGCEIERRGGDTWFFTYMSTAFLTGIFLLWMFLFPMTNHLLGQVILVVGWFVIIVLTLPVRKGLAIAIDYLIDCRQNNQRS